MNTFTSYIPYSLPLPFLLCCGIYRPWQKRIDPLDNQLVDRYRTFTLPTQDYLLKGSYVPAHFRYRKVKVFVNPLSTPYHANNDNNDNNTNTNANSVTDTTKSNNSTTDSNPIIIVPTKNSIYLDSSGSMVSAIGASIPPHSSTSSSSSTITTTTLPPPNAGPSQIKSTIIIPPKVVKPIDLSSKSTTPSVLPSSTSVSTPTTISQEQRSGPSQSTTLSSTEESTQSTDIKASKMDDGKEEDMPSEVSADISTTVANSNKAKARGRGRPPISYYGSMRQAIIADNNNPSNPPATNTNTSTQLTTISSTRSNPSNTPSAPVRLPLRYDIMDTIGWSKVRPLGGEPCIRLVNNKKLQTCRPGADYQVYLPPEPIAPLAPLSSWQQEQQSINAAQPWTPPILPKEFDDSETDDGEEKVPFEWPDNGTSDETEEDDTDTNAPSTEEEKGKENAMVIDSTTTTLTTTITEEKSEGPKNEGNTDTAPVVPTVETATISAEATTTTTITSTTDTVAKPEEKKKRSKGRTLFDLSNVQDPPPVPWQLARAEKEPMKLNWSFNTIPHNNIITINASRTRTLSIDDYLFILRKEAVALRAGIRVGAPHPRFLRSWPGVLICWTVDTNESVLSLLENENNTKDDNAFYASLSSEPVVPDSVAPAGYAYVSFIDSKHPTCVPLRSLQCGSLHQWVTDEECLQILQDHHGDILRSLDAVRTLIKTRKSEATTFHQQHKDTPVSEDIIDENGGVVGAKKSITTVNMELSHHESGQNIRQGIEALKGTIELSCLPRISSDTGLISSVHCEEFGKYAGGAGGKGWSPYQQVAFASGITRFGKNFHHIAGIIPEKTVGECVAYYFRNKHFRMLLQGIGYRSLNPTPRAGFKSADILRDSTTLYAMGRNKISIPMIGDIPRDPYPSDEIKHKKVTMDSSNKDGENINMDDGSTNVIQIGPPRLVLMTNAPRRIGPPIRTRRTQSRGRGRGRPPLRTRGNRNFFFQRRSNTQTEEGVEDEGEDGDEEEEGDGEDGDEEEYEENDDETNEMNEGEADNEDDETAVITNSGIPNLATATGQSNIDAVAAEALLDAVVDDAIIDESAPTVPNAEENAIMMELDQHVVQETLDEIEKPIAANDDMDDEENDNNDDDEQTTSGQETSGEDKDKSDENDETVEKNNELMMATRRRSIRGFVQIGDINVYPRELTTPDTQLHATLKAFGDGNTSVNETSSTNISRSVYPSIAPVAAAGILTRWCSLCRKMQSSVLVCTNPDCAATVCDRCFRITIQQRRFNPFGMPAKPSWRLARNNSWWMCCDCCPPIPTIQEWDLYSKWSKSLLALHALHAPALVDSGDESNDGGRGNNRSNPNPTDRTLRQRSGISFSDLQKNAYKPENYEEGGRTKRPRRDGSEIEETGKKRSKKSLNELEKIDYTPQPFVESKFDMSSGSRSKTVTYHDAVSYLGRIKDFFGPDRENGVASFMRLLNLYKKRTLTVITLMRDIIHLLTSYRAPKPLLRDFSFFVPAEHHAFYYESCIEAFRNPPPPYIDAGILPREGRKIFNRPIIPINGVLYIRGRQGHLYQLDYLSCSLDFDVNQYKVSTLPPPPPPILPPNLQHLQNAPQTSQHIMPPALPSVQPMVRPGMVPMTNTGYPMNINPSSNTPMHQPPINPMINPPYGPPGVMGPPTYSHHPFFPNQHPSHHPGLQYMPPGNMNPMARGMVPPTHGGNIPRSSNLPMMNNVRPGIPHSNTQGWPPGNNARPPFPGPNPNQMMMVMQQQQQQQHHQQQQQGARPPMIMNQPPRGPYPHHPGMPPQNMFPSHSMYGVPPGMGNPSMMMAPRQQGMYMPPNNGQYPRPPG